MIDEVCKNCWHGGVGPIPVANKVDLHAIHMIHHRATVVLNAVVARNGLAGRSTFDWDRMSLGCQRQLACARPEATATKVTTLMIMIRLMGTPTLAGTLLLCAFDNNRIFVMALML